MNLNIFLNKHMFNGVQMYLPRGMVNSNQKMIVSCKRSCMGAAFEGGDCVLVQIIREKCNRSKEYVSLENTNHVEAYVVHKDANKIRVMCNFCDRVFTS